MTIFAENEISEPHQTLPEHLLKSIIVEKRPSQTVPLKMDFALICFKMKNKNSIRLHSANW